MKDFFEIMEKDFMDENFSEEEVILYGIIAPLVLVVVIALAGMMEAACM